MDALKKDTISKIQTWNNRLFAGKKSMNDLRWVRQNHQKISNYIEKQYSKPSQINSRKSHYSALAVVFREVEIDPKLQKLYATIATQLNALHNKQAENQQLSERQKVNWRSWDEIVGLRDELAKQKTQSHTSLRNYLIVALNTLTPPLRGTIRDMPINKPSDTTNWLELNDKGNAFYHINHDKVSSKMGKDTIELTKEATDVLRESLEQWPRAYVLGNSKIPESTYQGILRKTLHVGINNFRNSYITNWARKKRTIASQKALARLMRHSYGSQQLFYSKHIDDNDEYEPEAEEKYERKEPAIVRAKLPPRIIKVKAKRPDVVYIHEEPKHQVDIEPTSFDRSRWSREYAIKNKDKVKARIKAYFLKHKDSILRKKEIRELNTSNIIEAKPETLAKYNIRFNEHTKRYE